MLLFFLHSSHGKFPHHPHIIMTIIDHHDDHLNIFTVLQENDQILSFRFKYVICSVYLSCFSFLHTNELNTGAMLSLLTDTHVAWVSSMEWVGKIKSVQRVAFLSPSIHRQQNNEELIAHDTCIPSFPILQLEKILFFWSLDY